MKQRLIVAFLLGTPTTILTPGDTNSTPSRSSAAKVGEIFGKAVFGVLVEKVLERSAIALIAAIV